MRLKRMALGKRKPKQEELFISSIQLATGPGHPFYSKLNQVLAQSGFDDFTETLCAPYYKEGGRLGIPPGTYFRMLFIGYFEGNDSQRGIAWRCADNLPGRQLDRSDTRPCLDDDHTRTTFEPTVGGCDRRRAGD